MALRFRHDPPSFKLPEDIWCDVYNNSKKEGFTRYIFGYSVHFTEDKVTKLQKLELRPHSFRTFQKSFFEFLNKQKKADKDAAIADFKLKKKPNDPFAQPGEYDKRGNWMGAFDDPNKEKKYNEELAQEKDEVDTSTPAEELLKQAEEQQKQWAEYYRKQQEAANQQDAGHGNTGHNQKQGDSFEDEASEQKASEKREKRERQKQREQQMQQEQEQQEELERLKRQKEQEKRDKREKQEKQDERSERRKDRSSRDDTSSKDDADAKGDKARQDAKTSSSKDSKSSSARRLKLRDFDLSSLQRPKDVKEIHVPVKRGDYNKVKSEIVDGKDGGYVITGPTGCGKSTVALLKLFTSKKVRVLVVEPTQANAANIEHEFRNILPNLVARVPELGTVPEVAFRALTTMREPIPQLVVTTTEKVLEYFNYHGRLTQFDYLVLDEFHLPIYDMVEVVELMRTFNVVKKYILVSATAEGFKINAALPAAVTAITGVLPLGKFPAVLEGSDLDPRIWASRGDGTYAVVPPSVTMANTLYKQYRDWNIRTFLITRHTYASDYLKAVKNYQARTCFVLEPGVEAGVTISMAVLTSMGATMAVRYDGDVVIEDIQPLGRTAGIQRGSRAGRVIPTLYIEPETPEHVPAGSSADYYRAQAIIKMIAMGAKTAEMKDNGIFATFPRLRTVTRELALASLEERSDPFISIYRHNDAGQVFVECGGKGDGFHALAKGELKLYYWPAGFYVAPISDFSRLDSEPDTFVLRSHQLAAARKMVEAVPGLDDKYTLDELVDLLIGKMNIYVNDLFDLLKSIFVGSKPTPFALKSKPDQAPVLEDFLGPAPEVLKLFTHMATEPVGIKFIRNVFEERGTQHAEHSFQYNGKQLNFSFPADYTVGGVIDVEKLSRAVHSKLQHILAVEILVNGAPEKCVDLLKYRDRVSEEHVWFTRVREHGSGANSN